MARASDNGTGSRIIVSTPQQATVESPWSLSSYPYPDPDFAFPEDTELAYSEERLYWRDSRTLAYGQAKYHPVAQEPLLMTWSELSTPPDTLPSRPEKRRRR
jgi:hypothetical protein